MGVLGLVGLAYPRLRGGGRAATALVVGFFGIAFGVEGANYTMHVGPSGDNFTGLLSMLAGIGAARPRARDAVADPPVGRGVVAAVPEVGRDRRRRARRVLFRPLSARVRLREHACRAAAGRRHRSGSPRAPPPAPAASWTACRAAPGARHLQPGRHRGNRRLLDRLPAEAPDRPATRSPRGPCSSLRGGRRRRRGRAVQPRLGHVGAQDARPREYEQRAVRFLDNALRTN
jgi:hypothetical protein